MASVVPLQDDKNNKREVINNEPKNNEIKNNENENEIKNENENENENENNHTLLHKFAVYEELEMLKQIGVQLLKDDNNNNNNYKTKEIGNKILQLQFRITEKLTNYEQYLNALSSKTLISDIVLNICSFLNIYEQQVIHRVNKQWNECLPIKKIFDVNNLHLTGDYNDVDKPIQNETKISLLSLSSLSSSKPYYVSSIDTKCVWKDQGWGNRKSQIYLRLYRNNACLLHLSLFGIAEHHDETKQITITKENQQNYSDILNQFNHATDHFEMWRYVGGGGGHELFITSFMATFEFRIKHETQ